jgi:putative ATPase
MAKKSAEPQPFIPQKVVVSEKQPLAAKLRPKTLSDIIGQEHLIGPGKPLRKLVEAKKLSSLIIWGPAGTGKTTIARCMALDCKMQFVELNATDATVKEIRMHGDQAKEWNVQTLLFVDEIHRFSKTQQDVLLPYVEDGFLTLVGATTENPFTSINAALCSRSQMFGVEPLTKKHLLQVMLRGLAYYRENNREIGMAKDAAQHILNVCNGDARKVLTVLETCVEVCDGPEITLELAQHVAPSKYMALGDTEHFDYASWVQGAIQASDPDAAVYALAVWLESGEDPRYIARRLMVSASEDAASHPQAALIANNAFVAACNVGRPECDIILSHAVITIANAPRDKSAAKAIWAAVNAVKTQSVKEVPKPLRDCHYAGAKELGHGSFQDGHNIKEYIGIDQKFYFPPSAEDVVKE